MYWDKYHSKLVRILFYGRTGRIRPLIKAMTPRCTDYAPLRLLQVDDVLEVLAGCCCCCMLWLLDCAAAHRDALGPALNSRVLSGRPLAAPWNPIAAAICKQSMVRRAVAQLSCG